MKTRRLGVSLILAAASLGLIAIVHCGCEDSPSDEGINNTFNNNPYQSSSRGSTTTPTPSESFPTSSAPSPTPPAAPLTIVPASASAQAGQLLAFQADGGSAPYSWSVGTPANGTITAQGDTRYAIYSHAGTSNDINSVVVSDSSGATAIGDIN